MRGSQRCSNVRVGVWELSLTRHDIVKPLPPLTQSAAVGFLDTLSLVAAHVIVGMGVGLAWYGGMKAARWLVRQISEARRVALLVSDNEMDMGKTLLAEGLVTNNLKDAVILRKNHADTRLVEWVMNCLIAVMSNKTDEGGSRTRYHWQVFVVQTDEVHAFIAPGAVVVVTTGLLSALKRDQDMLAMLLGHEIAHAMVRSALLIHGSAELHDVPGVGAGPQAIMMQSGDNPLAQGLNMLRRAVTSTLRSQLLRCGMPSDQDADLIGLYLMALAGFDTSKAPVLLERQAHLEFVYHGSNGILPRCYNGPLNPRACMARARLLQERVKEMRSRRARGLPAVETDDFIKSLNKVPMHAIAYAAVAAVADGAGLRGTA